MGAGHGCFANADQQLGRHGRFRGQQTGYQQFMTGKQREADDRRKQQPLAPLNFATPKRAGEVEELFE